MRAVGRETRAARGLRKRAATEARRDEETEAARPEAFSTMELPRESEPGPGPEAESWESMGPRRSEARSGTRAHLPVDDGYDGGYQHPGGGGASHVGGEAPAEVLDVELEGGGLGDGRRRSRGRSHHGETRVVVLGRGRTDVGA
ncbi:hypothetical protein G6O67_005434 [Ophiocordyceps sinensis]|uniref:Uncharacterized protein n=1 Tax=Ophiocordyceps sinensis TaxID=72228 RepID=A0A8H4V5X4_9HYPO|nr:hypothetical protein G6O67_005434 [Ophiocordyceps sinensis]